jgi:endo-1,4-beta-D-glucanase Y
VRRGRLFIGAGLSALAVGLIWWALSRPAVDAATQAAIDHFFAAYVTDEGRVRRSEGDTVSEGQAYALLMAVASDHPQRFATVWEWTRSHLIRSDGAMAWLWDGEVVDEGLAPDADVDAAVALHLAAERFEKPGYARAADRMARAVVDAAVIDLDGELVLSAGEWAAGSDAVINPSYLDPASFEFLARQTGDGRWGRLADSARAILAELTDTGLPPDWAVMTGDSIRPIASPDERNGPGRFGFDALRVPLRLATECTASLAAAIASSWAVIAEAPGIAVRHLDGRPAADGAHPAAFASAAAIASSAEPQQVEELLELARRQDEKAPSYYGAAWVALGRLMLTTTTLERCA